MNGIIEEITGNNVKIDGKTFFCLPAVQPYLKNFKVGDTVTYNTSKNDKGAISFMKAGHVEGSKVPKEKPIDKPVVTQQSIDAATDPKAYWDTMVEKVKAMHPEDRVQWAVKILEDLHGIPDRIELLARMTIKEKREADKLAETVAQPATAAQPQATSASPAPTLPTASPAPAAALKKAAEYRDPREVRIVRQSCLKAAVELVCGREIPIIGDEEPEGKPMSVTGIAEHFEKWVWREIPKEESDKR